MEIEIKSGKINFVENGPARLEGDFEVSKDGEIMEKKERVSICRCGESMKMPFCDGTHKKVGFKG